MIKIKNNQTGEERVIPAKYYFKSGINLGDYEIIEWKDVVHLYADGKKPVSLGIMSRLEAKKYLDSGTNYYVENVPRPDLKTVAVITPEQVDVPAIQTDIPAIQTDIPAIQKRNSLSFIKDITLLEWAAIGGLLALIAALWTIFI